MIFILEGMHNAGKTTMANYLIQRFPNADCIKIAKTPSEAVAFLQTIPSDKILIIDRLCLYKMQSLDISIEECAILDNYLSLHNDIKLITFISDELHWAEWLEEKFGDNPPKDRYEDYVLFQKIMTTGINYDRATIDISIEEFIDSIINNENLTK